MTQPSLPPRRIAFGPSAVRKRCGRFLSLPGELRNLVYDFFFCMGFEVELAAQRASLETKAVRSIKLCITSVAGDGTFYQRKNLDAKRRTIRQVPLRMSRMLGSYKRPLGIYTDWSHSFCALLLVCKQVHEEAVRIFYASATLVCNAPNRLSNFLTHIPDQYLAWVTRLRLHYITYGNPSDTFHSIFRLKHQAKWTSVCKMAAKHFVSLSELTVYLQVSESPLHFDFQQAWLLPLASFRRLTRPHKTNTHFGVAAAGPLKNVKIRLSTSYTKQFAWWDDELAMACRDLHALFGEAIARRILGWNERDALADYLEAWDEKYVKWQDHLNFCAMV